MFTNFEIYVQFRKAQSNFLNRPYRLPKDWDNYLETKMPVKHREVLETVTGFFNTKWRNIEPEKFFDCGFEMFKNRFSYMKFFDSRVLKLYIEKDKIIKREWELVTEKINNSILFIKEFMNKTPHRKDLSMIRQYCLLGGGERYPVRHFIENKIDKYIIVWLISKQYLNLTDEERTVIPIIIENFRLYHTKLYSVPSIMRLLSDTFERE